jgi:hypothetical protein
MLPLRRLLLSTSLILIAALVLGSTAAASAYAGPRQGHVIRTTDG